MTKIAITGIGVVSTFGLGRETFWDHVRRGVSGTRAISEFDATSYPCRVAAAVPPVTIDGHPVLQSSQFSAWTATLWVSHHASFF